MIATPAGSARAGSSTGLRHAFWRPSTAGDGDCLVSDGSSGRAPGVQRTCRTWTGGASGSSSSSGPRPRRRARGGRRGRAHPHLGRGQDGGRAGRGRAGPPRDRRRRRRVVAAADLAREQGPRARPGPPRRHPEPDAPDLPRARGRLHHPAGQEQAARGAVDLVGLRLRGDGQGHRGGDRRRRAAARSRCSWPTRRCRRATRPRSRRRPTRATTRSAGTSTRRAPRPIRRARSTPTARSRPARWACASGSRSPRPT